MQKRVQNVAIENVRAENVATMLVPLEIKDTPFPKGNAGTTMLRDIFCRDIFYQIRKTTIIHGNNPFPKGKFSWFQGPREIKNTSFPKCNFGTTILCYDIFLSRLDILQQI